MTLEKYTKMFSNLRTDKGRNRYPVITRHRAPHKPFLLLSVMDLIGQGEITTNFISPTFDLVDTFNGYWSAVMPTGAKTSMAYPFSRLRTDCFWHSIPKSGYDPDIEYTPMLHKQRADDVICTTFSDSCVGARHIGGSQPQCGP